MVKTISMSEVIRKNAESEGCQYWFSPDTMGFFNSVVETKVAYVKDGKAYFISSERRERGMPKRYTIREFDIATADIRTVGEFQEFPTKSGAMDELKSIVGG